MTQLLEGVDAVGDPAFLETDKPENVRFYERSPPRSSTTPSRSVCRPGSCFAQRSAEAEGRAFRGEVRGPARTGAGFGEAGRDGARVAGGYGGR
jgi:hypothetical protein